MSLTVCDVAHSNLSLASIVELIDVLIDQTNNATVPYASNQCLVSKTVENDCFTIEMIQCNFNAIALKLKSIIAVLSIFVNDHHASISHSTNTDFLKINSSPKNDLDLLDLLNHLTKCSINDIDITIQ
jgi:hypothetical protein